MFWGIFFVHISGNGDSTRTIENFGKTFVVFEGFFFSYKLIPKLKEVIYTNTKDEQNSHIFISKRKKKTQ